MSPEIHHEYRRVSAALSTKHPTRSAALEPVLTLLAMNATMIDAPTLEHQVSEDPNDDMFLVAALASRSGFIVSGDRHLLDVSGWNDIQILTPRQFAETYLR
jgi:uncharacterized protein